MTAQDADEQESESVPADEQDSVEAETAETETDETAREDEAAETVVESDETADSVSALLSELAEAPEGDVDEVLAEIVSDGVDVAGDQAMEPDASAVETPIHPSEVTVSDELLEEVESSPSEHLARTLAVMRAEIDRLHDELGAEGDRADDLESRLARKQADFQNYKKRQKQRLEDEKQRATEDLVTRLLEVRDNLARALDQDEGTDIRGGVESTLEQFDQQLDRENVERIEPEVGAETDPRRHEVLATIASEQPEDTIAQIHRPGYVMGEKVLRPAQVAVSDGSLADEG